MCLILSFSNNFTLIKIRALILENTFLSMPKMVPHALPVLGPFVSLLGASSGLIYLHYVGQAFLCHQKWDSETRLPLIPASIPILMLSGSQDEVVPPSHMRDLWEIAQGRGAVQKAPTSEIDKGTRASKFVEFPNGAHSEFLL
jgi:abhydrolase domain-containing protein 13